MKSIKYKNNNFLSLKFLRKSKFVRFSVYLLIFSIVLLSCNPDSVMTSEITTAPSGSTAIVLTQQQSATGTTSFYNLMELVRTVDSQNDFSSSEERFRYFLESNDTETENNINSVINSLNQEQIEVQDLGYEDYLDAKASEGKISSSLESWMLDYQTKITNFINTKPSESDLVSFLGNTNNFLPTINLSDSEQSTITKMLAISQDFVHYYYMHYNQNNVNTREADCDFWEGAACGLLYLAIAALVVYIIHSIIVALLPAGALIPVYTTAGEFLGYATAGEAGTLIGVGLTAMLVDLFWTSFFEWCCGKKPKAICAAPTGYTVKRTDCNKYNINIFGPGNYSTTNWVNTNLIPAAAITPTPNLTVELFHPFDDGKFDAKSIICIALPSGDVTSYQQDGIVKSAEERFTLTWSSAPPSEVSISDSSDDEEEPYIEFGVSVSPSNSSIYSYSWSISDYEILPDDASATIVLEYPSAGDSFTTTVVVKNKCTGEEHTISKTTTIVE